MTLSRSAKVKLLSAVVLMASALFLYRNYSIARFQIDVDIAVYILMACGVKHIIELTDIIEYIGELYLAVIYSYLLSDIIAGGNTIGD